MILAQLHDGDAESLAAQAKVIASVVPSLLDTPAAVRVLEQTCGSKREAGSSAPSGQPDVDFERAQGGLTSDGEEPAVSTKGLIGGWCEAVDHELVRQAVGMRLRWWRLFCEEQRGLLGRQRGLDLGDTAIERAE
eukprot:scaffold160068_cov35-Tisochrysis_lutea.AAC.1